MTTPRNLTASFSDITTSVERHESLARAAIDSAEQEPDDPHQYALIDVPSHMARGLLQRYLRATRWKTCKPITAPPTSRRCSMPPACAEDAFRSTGCACTLNRR